MMKHQSRIQYVSSAAEPDLSVYTGHTILTVFDDTFRPCLGLPRQLR